MAAVDTTTLRQIGDFSQYSWQAGKFSVPSTPEHDLGNAAGPHLRGPCVLVVDDERYIVDFVGILLEEEGYRVLRAYDGQEAWDLVRTATPDLVISDVMMPRMNGLELLRRLRESRELGRIPVILMSAVTQLDAASEVRFLPKPFDIDRMLELVTAGLAAN
jgi:CheY-like chemotaxis protein